MNKKTGAKIWTNRLVAGLGLSVALAAMRAGAFDVIDPTGSIYTGVTASSTFSSGFVSGNLFTTDVSSIAVGQSFTGPEYAKSGSGTAYVTFQVDQPYNVGSIYWAQRAGGNTGDNMQLMSVWVSTNGPFTAVAQTNAPDAIVSLLPNSGSPVWREYQLTNAIVGQYFLMKLEQTAGHITGNPGGAEMRLGLQPPPVPPTVTKPPVDKSVYASGTARFSIAVSGPLPITFQWYHGATLLSNGGRISGADQPALTISNITGPDGGQYSCVASNSYGTNGASANLTVLSVPASGEAQAIYAKSPVAFYQLDESSGTNALDYAGTLNGADGIATTIGLPGPQSPTFPGFSGGNLAAGISYNTPSSAIALPPLNLNGSNVTMLAWINPSDNQGAQQIYSGVVFSRSANTAAGLIFASGTDLGYQWGGARYDFASGLTVPNNQWSLVALVVTPTNAMLYCGSSNIMKTATDVFPEPVQTFAGTTYIGVDTDVGESIRTFNGAIDDVAFFDRALSETEINAIYAAGAGTLTPVGPQIVTPPTNEDLYLGETLTLSVLATGTPPRSYQWFKDNSPINGATNATYSTIAHVSDASANYTVTVSNSVGSVSSDPVAVTVSSNILRVLDPTGKIYAQAKSSSIFAAGWEPANLFTTDVSSLAIGATMTTEGSPHEFAKKGGGDAWVTFQLDQVYPVGAVYWAQRVGSTTGDNMQVMDIWASGTNAFTTNDPGIPSDVEINLNPSTGNPTWTRYILPNTITGQYFLMHLQQTAVTGNPGGAEMRFAVTGVPAPLSIARSTNGTIVNWPSYGVLQQANSPTGPWSTATGVTNGAAIPITPGQKFFRVKYN